MEHSKHYHQPIPVRNTSKVNLQMLQQINRSSYNPLKIYLKKYLISMLSCALEDFLFCNFCFFLYFKVEILKSQPVINIFRDLI